MSERRTGRYLGLIETVLIYPEKGGCATRMLAERSNENMGRGCFFFDGKHVHFHKDDAKFKKFIVYQSVEQVQKSTRGTKKVRLRP